MQRTVPEAIAIGEACRAGFGNMRESIRSGIAEALRVAGSAYAEGIEYEQKCTRHLDFLAFCRNFLKT